MVTAALIATLGLVAGEPAQVAQAAPPVKAARVDTRPDLVSAQVTARSQGSRVEVESERTATSTTWANPTGTLTTEQHGGPIRFRDSDGSWRDVDLTLAEQADGSVAPKGHPGNLRLMGATKTASLAVPSAGENDVVSADEGKGGVRGVSLAWQGRLGKPTLAGNRATYANVQPGVDLVVEVLRTGFEQSFVIRDAAALARLTAAAGSGSDVSWSLPAKTRGLTARSEADGSVSFVDAKNVVASRLAAPKAWDAVVDPRSGEHTSTSPVKLTVAQRGKGKAVVTMTPDQGWLTDPARVFPITIDPTYASANVTTSFDTYVSSLYSTAEYSTATELRVGTYNGGGDKYRSFLTFPLASFKGKQVVSASLSLYEFHSWSCTARAFYVYSAGTASSATNWSNQPAPSLSYGSLNTAKGYSSSCAAGRVSVPVTTLVHNWSVSTPTSGGIRLHADETDSYAWKKFYSLESSQDPYITFTYNRKPDAASAPTLQAPPATSYAPAGSSTAALFTSDSTPLFSSKTTDPDANTVAMTVEVWNSAKTLMASSCLTAYVASGATGSCSPTTALADSGLYYARTKVQDQMGLWNGTWSPWTAFYTTWSTPPVPAISCPAPYSNGSWQDQAPTADITCTVTAAGVAGNYAAPGYVNLTVDGVVKPQVKLVVSNDPAIAKTTVVVPKTSAGGHTITAVSVSRTLKVSAAATHSFGWGGASLTTPAAKTATSGKISLAAAGPPRGTAAGVTAKMQWRVAGSGTESTGWTDGPALTVPAVAATAPVTASPTTWDVRTAVREAGATADVPTRTPVLLDVQVCFAYTGVATSQCTWSQSPVSVTRVPHAFAGGYPTAAAGPGQAALFTGEFNTSTTDVTVPGYAGDLALSRSHTSFDGDGTVAGWPKDAVTGVFGPGWTASLQGPEAGGAGVQVIDNTRLDGTIVLVDEQGSPLVYQNPDLTRTYKIGSEYLPATTDTVEAATDLVLSGTGLGMTMVATEEDGTKTTWKPVAAPVTTADTHWKPFSVSEPGQLNATTYGHDSVGRVTRIVAAVPEGMATTLCPTVGPLAKGCRALEISYATANSATFPGDYAGQVKSVSATLWDPATPAILDMTPTVVATYQYDASGRLVKATNPRTNLSTDYTWDGTSTRLASFKPSGLAASRLVYDMADPKLPKVSAVTRDAPSAGGPSVTISRFVYGVPLTGTGLPDLSAAGVAPWDQAKAAASGYAVFGADYTGPVTGAGVDWSYGDLQYADAQGYTVNTAAYGAGGWQISATDYDALGNEVRELDAGAIATIKAAAGSLDAGQVDALSTQTIYNADIKDAQGVVVTPAGTLVTDTYGPVRTSTLAGGTDLPVRPHTETLYDQGAPTATNPATGQPWRLPTTVTTSASDGGAAPGAAGDLETLSTTVNSYAAVVAGDGDGWALGTPTQVTTGGITAVTRFDAAGRTIESRQPLSDGTTAGTTKTLYYTAGANIADSRCGDKAEWAGLLCRTYPAAAPSSGPTLPDELTKKYSMWLQAEQTEETSGTTTRTTETGFDPAGRAVASWTTSTIPGSTSRAGTFTHYRDQDGLVDYTGTLNAAKTDADPTGRTSSTYDLWGRQLTFTNDLGDTTTTTYDPAGRVASVADAKGTTTNGYDGTDADDKPERRGLATSLTITRGGTAGTLTFAGAYDADGKLVTQKLPGAITATSTFDEAGEPTGLAYSGQVTPVTETTDPETGQVTYTPGTPLPDKPWLAWTQTNDATGRVRREFTGAGAGFDGVPGVSDPADITAPAVGAAIASDREYTYDTAGRLTRVADRTAAGYAATGAMPCTVRDYAFNNNGSRVGLETTTHPDGDCASTTGATTKTLGYDYDDADRPTTTASVDGAPAVGSYTYDEFGRQATLPGADAPDPGKGDITLAYYDDDLPQAITQNGTTTAYTLNTGGRRATSTTGPTGGTATSTTTRHYTDTSDNPAWADTTTTGIGGGTSTTRYAGSLAGDLGATIAEDGTATLPLANLHGDVLTNVTIPATQTGTTPAAGIDGWSDYTEYGTPRDPAATTTVAGTAGYGWLGAKERSTTTESAGLTLMGDRLYNATTGRFTSLDPEPGGNPTAYTYPTDPINTVDLDGHSWSWKSAAKWSGIAASVACIALSAGLCAAGAGIAAGISMYNNYRRARTERSYGWKRFARDSVIDVAGARFSGVRGMGKYLGRHRGAMRGISRLFPRRSYSSYRSTRAAFRSRPWRSTGYSALQGYYGVRSYTGSNTWGVKHRWSRWTG